MVSEGAQPELSRLVAVSELPRAGLDLHIEANAAERAALTRRLELIALNALRAQVRVEREKDLNGADLVRVEGRFAADVVQSCVATLEPFEASVEEEFTVEFAPLAASGAPPETTDPTLIDLPEPLIDDQIDVGELVAEHLALSLDPHPKRPGAPAINAEFPPPAPEPRGGEGPFAALGQLKGKM